MKVKNIYLYIVVVYNIIKVTMINKRYKKDKKMDIFGNN